MVCRIWLAVGRSTLLAHATLIGLILRVGVVAAVLLRLLLAVVAGMTLRVRGIILAVGDALLSINEATSNRWPERICSSRRAKV